MINKFSVLIAAALFFLLCLILREFGKQNLLLQIIAVVILILTTAFILLALCTVAKGSTVAEENSSSKHTRPMSTDDLPKDFQVKMNYAWGWFQYHADQRLKAFNFFLVILGILIVAYGAAMKEGLTNAATAKQGETSAPTACTKSPRSAIQSQDAASVAAASYSMYAAIVALCGVVISIAFFMIEIRNIELVGCGRNWLEQLEVTLNVWPRHEDDEREHLDAAIHGLLPRGRSPNKDVITHWFWIRIIYGMACLGFLLAFSKALCGF